MAESSSSPIASHTQSINSKPKNSYSETLKTSAGKISAENVTNLGQNIKITPSSHSSDLATKMSNLGIGEEISEVKLDKETLYQQSKGSRTSTNPTGGRSSMLNSLNGELGDVEGSLNEELDDPDVNLSDLATPQMKNVDRIFPDVKPMEVRRGNKIALGSPRRHSNIHFSALSSSSNRPGGGPSEFAPEMTRPRNGQFDYDFGSPLYGEKEVNVPEEADTGDNSMYALPPNFVRSRYNSRSYGGAQGTQGLTGSENVSGNLGRIEEHRDSVSRGSSEAAKLNRRRITLGADWGDFGYTERANDNFSLFDEPPLQRRGSRTGSEDFIFHTTGAGSVGLSGRGYGGFDEPPLAGFEAVAVARGAKGSRSGSHHQNVGVFAADEPVYTEEDPNEGFYKNSIRRHSTPPRHIAQQLRDQQMQLQQISPMNTGASIQRHSVHSGTGSPTFNPHQGPPPGMGHVAEDFLPDPIGFNDSYGMHGGSYARGMVPGRPIQQGFVGGRGDIGGYQRQLGNVNQYYGHGGKDMDQGGWQQNWQLGQMGYGENRSEYQGGYGNRVPGGGPRGIMMPPRGMAPMRQQMPRGIIPGGPRQIGRMTGPMGAPNLINGAMCDALQEYRATGKRPTMDLLQGHVVEFSKDSHGSRFIQFKMETASEEERKVLIDEVLIEAVILASHPFGNYVIQNFLLHATPDQRFLLAATFKGHMVRLSTQAHGCRVVQYAMDIVTLPQRNVLMKEVVENIYVVSKNNHGTHVVQKCMNFLLTETLEFSPEDREKLDIECKKHSAPTSHELLHIVEVSVLADLLKLSVHPHSYRLVQQTLANCNPNRSKEIADILKVVEKNYYSLAVDQHGNFILQHILDHGSVEQANEVQRFVCSRVLELAQHKFGSHLVEKCLTSATKAQCAAIVHQILHPTDANLSFFKKTNVAKDNSLGELMDDEPTALFMLSKDPYANFVVQRAFDQSGGEERSTIAHEIRKRSDILSRFTYGRHILSHINRTDA